MKKIFAILVSVVLVAALFAGCQKSEAEKTYSEKSVPDKFGNYAEVKITKAGDKITKVEWKEYSKDGKEKDSNYGKGTGDENYQKAQDALAKSRTFGTLLEEAQDVSKIKADAVSGATTSFDTFKDLVNKALSK